MRYVFAGWLWIILLTAAAQAQLTGVRLEVDPADIGLDGYVQPGQWTALRLRLTNESAELRNVIARWALDDEDGDEVYAQRTAPLNPGVTQQLWLYAAIPVTTRDGSQWSIQIIDAETGSELARQRISPQHIISPRTGSIGVSATSNLGLVDYEHGATMHEKTNFIRGIMLANLPDRWYGMSMFRAMVWTPEAADPLNDPAGAAVTPEIADALRDWVRRGGHLVIMLPAVGQTWSDSPLRDLMPVSQSQIESVADFDPKMLGYVAGGVTPEPLPAVVFDVQDGGAVAVLARDRQGRAYAVAKRYGFGNVTLLGVDLSSGPVRKQGLPSGRFRVWNTIFHWQADVYSKSAYEALSRSNQAISPNNRNGLLLDDFPARWISMTGTAAPALFTAILVFCLYWVLAGPVSFAVLRKRGQMQYTWIAFVVTAGLFTAITWGGAWLMRPVHTKLDHVSVLDIDANTAQVHTQSWLALLVPEFGRAEVVVDPGEIGTGQLLASPGVERELAIDPFLDPQTYIISAADPRQVEVPVRSTAKRFNLDYFGYLNGSTEGVSGAWGLPAGEIRLADNGWPIAKLTHDLPGTLKDVMVLYCDGTTTSAGEVNAPWVGWVGQWQPKAMLELTSPPTLKMKRLVERPPVYQAKRNWATEGYLGDLVGQQKGVKPVLPPGVQILTDVEARALLMLSFYDTLPAMNYLDVQGSITNFNATTHYTRSVMRSIDISPLTAGRRLIVLGLLEESPLPAPLTLDGRSVPSNGLTLVRWIYDLE